MECNTTEMTGRDMRMRGEEPELDIVVDDAVSKGLPEKGVARGYAHLPHPYDNTHVDLSMFILELPEYNDFVLVQMNGHHIPGRDKIKSGLEVAVHYSKKRTDHDGTMLCGVTRIDIKEKESIGY